jgi:hypothetical protein
MLNPHHSHILHLLLVSLSSILSAVMSTPYQELVEQIIQKQSTVLGLPVAIRRAKNVAGIEVDDAGKVTAMPENVNQAFADLVSQYKALSGPVGLSNCKQAASEWFNTHPTSALPPILL